MQSALKLSDAKMFSTWRCFAIPIHSKWVRSIITRWQM